MCYPKTGVFEPCQSLTYVIAATHFCVRHSIDSPGRVRRIGGVDRQRPAGCPGEAFTGPGMRVQIDKAFPIAKPMGKASWTKRFAAGWGERRHATGDIGSGESGWWGWTGGVSQKSLAMRAAFKKPRSLWLENAAQGCRNRRFRSPACHGHGTPRRGYSPRNRVRQLPQWGHRGRAAS